MFDVALAEVGGTELFKHSAIDMDGPLRVP